MCRFRAAAASAGLAALLAAVAFIARGGSDLGRTTVAEALLLLAGGTVAVVAIARGRRAPLHGAGVLVAFAVYVAVVALSVTWSAAPELSLQDAGRELSYLALFAGAVAAGRTFSRAAPAVLCGLLAAVLTVCGWALLTRVFPGSLGGLALAPRLGEPFDYWNALASVAGIALVPALWLGTRREGSPLARSLAYPAAGVLMVALVLPQSRGGLLAATVGVALWLAFVPRRLRSLAVLLAGAAAAAPIAAWALSQNPFTVALPSLASREAVAGAFAAMLVAMLVVLTATGIAVEAIAERRAPSLRLRRRAGVIAVAAALIAPLALIGSVAASDRGLRGTFDRGVDGITSTRVPRGSARLGSTASARNLYWRDAWDIFSHEPLRGAGAGAFGIARLPYRSTANPTKRAHGFVVEAMADTGTVGLAAVLALLAAWLIAAARTLGIRLPRRPGPRPPWDGERISLGALALAAVTFGVESAVDLTWFVPGVAALGVVAAGFVAGRGPLVVSGAPPRAPAAPLPRAERAVWATAAALSTLIFAWVVVQPARADRALKSSVDRLSRGDSGGAVRFADRARELDPLSLAALLARASGEREARRPAAELATLLTAAREHPRSPEPWVRLADFELDVLGDPSAARRYAAVAQRLDPQALNTWRPLLARAQSGR